MELTAAAPSRQNDIPTPKNKENTHKGRGNWSTGNLSWWISIPTGNTCCPHPVTPQGVASRQPVRVPQHCQLLHSSAKAAATLTSNTLCYLSLAPLPPPPTLYLLVQTSPSWRESDRGFKLQANVWWCVFVPTHLPVSALMLKPRSNLLTHVNFSLTMKRSMFWQYSLIWNHSEGRNLGVENTELLKYCFQISVSDTVNQGAPINTCALKTA